jgi:hypothetical protein
MEFRCEAPFVVEPPLVGQHFFLFLCVVAPRVYCTKKILASFFLEFLRTVYAGESDVSGRKNCSWMKYRTRYRCAPKVTILSLISVRNTLLKLQVAHVSSLALHAEFPGGRRCPQRVGNAASPPDICAFGQWFCHRLTAVSRSNNALAFALFFSAKRFECAVLCWSVSEERGELNLAGD